MLMPMGTVRGAVAVYAMRGFRAPQGTDQRECSGR